MQRFAALLCLWVLASTAPDHWGRPTLAARSTTLLPPAPSPSAPRAPQETAWDISVGDEVMDTLTFHGDEKFYELTAPSDGTLLVRVSWEPDRGRIQLDVGYTSWVGYGVIVAKLPVIAGGKYSVTVADAAPWDYDELLLPFVLTTSMEAEPESVLYDLVATHSRKCLDVNGLSLDDGTPLIQWYCHGGNNQIWSVAPSVDGYVQIISRNSGKCLDVNGESLDDGAAVIQSQCHGRANQQWLIERLDTGFSRIIARHSGKCLDVYAASLEDGASVIQWQCHGGQNQSWYVRTRLSQFAW